MSIGSESVGWSRRVAELVPGRHRLGCHADQSTTGYKLFHCPSDYPRFAFPKVAELLGFLEAFTGLGILNKKQVGVSGGQTYCVFLEAVPESNNYPIYEA